MGKNLSKIFRWVRKLLGMWVPVMTCCRYLEFPLPTTTARQWSLTFSMYFKDIYLNSRTAYIFWPPPYMLLLTPFLRCSFCALTSFNRWALLVFVRLSVGSSGKSTSPVELPNDWFAFLRPPKCFRCSTIASHLCCHHPRTNLSLSQDKSTCHLNVPCFLSWPLQQTPRY